MALCTARRKTVTLLASQLFALASFTSAPSTAQKPPDTRLRIASPDGQIVFILSDAPHTHALDPASNDLRYSVDFHKKWFMDESVLGIKLEGRPALGPGMKQMAMRTVQGDRAHAKPVPCNDVFVDLADDAGRKLSLEVRAYNDGVAFRYIVPRQPALQTVRVESELTQFVYNKNATVYPSIVNALSNAPAIQDRPRAVANVSPQWLIAMPLLSQVIDVGWVSIDETKTEGYPALLLRKVNTALGFQTEFASSAAQNATAAKDQAAITSSWRVLAIGDVRSTIVTPDLVSRLSVDRPAR